MHWGKGIVIGMMAFMCYIIAMGVAMFRQPDDVDSHYYEKGLAFNTDYDKEKQVLMDNAQPMINIEANTLLVKFAKPAKGTVDLKRPDNDKLDRHINLQSNQTGNVAIPLNQLKQGRWQLVFNWESSGKKYLYTTEVYTHGR
ncbi:hypothetical protein LX99_03168 [Mucilaginibacter oryzae]|uniref:FixH protein n=1 Tax=Mucilaginibacter oryzae TaxID=468058 RepID=A0A316HGJ8_9SPHI|nr:FixH family protein [Mucilaginibacter oryzae]PWK77355.1 hypothetical protein LX99_03168 [Mucilaginibacter oryzae]